PVLPHTAVCLVCGEAGKEDTVDDPDDKFSLCLMECTICNEIIHPSCLKMGKAEGIINDEIPNCWECPKCHKEGKTSKDQTDGSGKRRLDNGEVGRWKITDDPPPKKKAPPSGEEVSRGGDSRAEGGRGSEVRGGEGRSTEGRAEGRSNDGHKRKKEKEPAPDSGKKKPKSEENGSGSGPGSGGGAQASSQSGSGGGGSGGGASGSSNQDQRSHQREKLERFKRMCLLERRLSSSSSSSSSDFARNPPPPALAWAPPPRCPRPTAARCPMAARGACPCPSHAAGRPPPRAPQTPRPLERHLVKPPPHCPEPSLLPLTTGHAHILHRDTWVRVFTHLSHRELCVCMRVCRTWSRWCCDKRLWSHIDLSRQRSITAPMLSGIIRRQPVSLNLGSTNISKKQLMWLLNRLQGLEQLVLCGCLWASVSALCLTVCPCLRLLDLSRVEDLKDSHLKELLAPPPDARIAHGDSRGGRFQGVTELRLAGLELTDSASRLLLRYTPHLQRLDLSYCPLLSDQSIVTLTSGLSPLRDRLTHLTLTGCARLSEQCVPLLRRCSSLQTVDLRCCPQLSSD
ncbi:hypothetical protein NL108_017064, partial [Boleophthalmus pectinirostris]